MRTSFSAATEAILMIAAALAVLSCDTGISILNVMPEVTGIGPVALEDAGEVSIFFWVRDHEEGAVDVRVELVRGSAVEALTGLGDHGTAGLTSARAAPGRAHRITWEPTGVGTDEPIRLRFTPTDDQGETGPSTDTPEFTLASGLPAPGE